MGRWHWKIFMSPRWFSGSLVVQTDPAYNRKHIFSPFMLEFTIFLIIITRNSNNNVYMWKILTSSGQQTRDLFLSKYYKTLCLNLFFNHYFWCWIKWSFQWFQLHFLWIKINVKIRCTLSPSKSFWLEFFLFVFQNINSWSAIYVLSSWCCAVYYDG